MENVPTAIHVSELKVRGSMDHLHLTVNTEPSVPGRVNGTIWFAGAPVTTFEGDTFTELWVAVPSPQLWHPDTPNLYQLTLTVTEPSTGNVDNVGSYFGMREVATLNFTSPPTPPSGARVGWDNSGGDLPGMPVTLASADYNLCWALCNKTADCVAWSYGVPSCGGDSASPVCWLKGATEAWSQNQCRVAGDNGAPGGPALRPSINGKFTFLTGFLDQSWWSDGEYAAPTDDALKFDLQIVKDLGMNVIRLHQKVNPQRWYYWADTLGVAILHDMVQKYGGATSQTVEPFMKELKAMIDGVGNHPSIIQWETFNEGDCYGVFDVPEVVAWTKAYDPHRLVDTNSGGGANDLHIGDVNDIHSCVGTPCDACVPMKLPIHTHHPLPLYMRFPTPSTQVPLAGQPLAERDAVRHGRRVRRHRHLPERPGRVGQRAVWHLPARGHAADLRGHLHADDRQPIELQEQPRRERLHLHADDGRRERVRRHGQHGPHGQVHGRAGRADQGGERGAHRGRLAGVGRRLALKESTISARVA